MQTNQSERSWRDTRLAMVKRFEDAGEPLPPMVWSKRKWAPEPPDGAIYVGRGTPWGNPYRCIVGNEWDHHEVVKKFHTYAKDRLTKEPHWLDPLRGKHLVCWCEPLPCHANILMGLAGENNET